MLTLHAAWLPAAATEPALALWAEDAGARRPARTRVASGVPAHPYAATVPALRGLLIPCSVGGALQDGEVVALLPSRAGAPVASFSAERDDDAGESLQAAHANGGRAPKARPAGEAIAVAEPSVALILAPYRVPCLLLDAAHGVDLLAALNAEALAAAVLGEDLRFWQQAAEFALSLLVRQRLLPDLQIEDAAFVARWRPLIAAGPDADRLAALANAMPPAARALLRAADPPPAAPRTLLRDFLYATVDALARRALAGQMRAEADATPARAWLAALCGRPQLAGRAIELSAFRSAFQSWSRPSGAQGADAAFRLCFRLRPPRAAEGVPAGDGWWLEYLLQAADDPSLLVELDEIWRAKGSAAHFFARRFDQPQERVLAALGRAAGLFPPIERSLRAATPSVAQLSADEAFAFVREAGPVLSEAGFGVLVPGMDSRLALRLKLSSPSTPAPKGGVAAFGWNEVVSFDWQIAIGDALLSRQEFEALVALKTPLVNVRGQWVELRAEAVEKALALLRLPDADGDVPFADALRLALAPEAATDLPVEQVDLEGRFSRIVDELRDGAAREELTEPPGFAGELRPYQRGGLSWLTTLGRFGLGACLADDMGLGKTVQLIATLLQRRQADPNTGPALLICPTSVVANWRRELERFAPMLRTLVHHGAARNRAEFATLAGERDVVISTYALLHRDAELFGAVAWSELVLDEAQNIKNPATHAAQTARALPARWRAALTGTPVENRLTDLWSIFQFLNPGLLGSAAQFRRTFGTPIERMQDADAAARLQKLVGPFILRRLKSDKAIIADLPEKNEATIFCTLTREQATLYQAVLAESLEQIEAAEGIERRGQILATLTKLKQVCDHPALLLHDQSRLAGRSGKLARLEEMLDEVVAAGDRALIFTQYAEMGTLLQRHLQETLGRETLFLHGGTSATAREKMVARFQTEAHGPQLFILSIKAGGTGLNLTRANHVFHFDRWWNPAVENQATDRAFRIGQRRDVQVHKYVCAGTFEETLDRLIQRKLALSEAIVGTGEHWITELSPAELREMFSLRSEAAVAE